jgi:putative membrane protein
MHPYSARSVITALSLALLLGACAEQQAQAEAPQQSTPVDAPEPGEVPAPNGQPTNMPPDEPPTRASNEAATGSPVAAADSTTALPAALTEGQIAHIADMANTAEIEQGKLALSKAKAPRVRAFAQKMVKHHEQAKAEQKKIIKELQLSPAESPESNVWKTDGDRAIGALRGASGSGFDRAYVDGQVDAHQKALDTIDKRLVPSAQNERIKSALLKAREVVASHLDEARSLQAELPKAP